MGVEAIAVDTVEPGRDEATVLGRHTRRAGHGRVDVDPEAGGSGDGDHVGDGVDGQEGGRPDRRHGEEGPQPGGGVGFDGGPERPDVEAASWMTPPPVRSLRNDGGRPSRSTSQSHTWASSSVVTGEVAQSMPCWPRVAATSSPSTAAGLALPGK